MNAVLETQVRPIRRVPGPSGLEHLCFFGLEVSNYATSMLLLQRRYGDVVRTRLSRPLFHIFHPHHIQRVLRTNAANYPKGRDYDLMRPILGNGLPVSDGDLWTTQRRLIGPEFRPKGIAQFVPIIVARTQAMLTSWSECSAKSQPINISEEFSKLALLIIGESLFEKNFEADIHDIVDDLATLMRRATLGLLLMGTYKEWLPTPGNTKAHFAARRLNSTVDRLVADARVREETGADILVRMVKAKLPDGTSMSDVQIRDETKTLIFAGHETTSVALGWTLYLLSRHPQVAARVAEEARRVLVGDDIDIEHVSRLRYARMVVLEVMRLYAPVPVVTRQAIEEDDFDGMRVRPGETVVISPYVTHRHPDFWSRPDEFDPERFAPERESSIQPCSYFPFLVGRRACIGEHFSLVESTLVLAMIAKDWELKLVSDEEIATMPSIALPPAKPIWMTAQRRAS